MVTPAPLNFLASIASCSNESDVEHKIIVPLLKLLGYEDRDWKSQAKRAKAKIDFLVHPAELLHTCPPYLIIEVKAPNQRITQSHWQIGAYMRQCKAPLGCLTNGSTFLILAQHQGQVAQVVEYSATDLIQHFRLFHKLLCKQTCLKVGDVIQRNQEHINWKFMTLISDAFANDAMLNLFKKKQPVSITEPPVNPQTNPQPNPQPSHNSSKAMIITVFNNKGGVGKTTLTINLAATFAKAGKRVLLIDIDAQANLSTGLGIDPLNDVELAGRKDITHLLLDPRTKLKDVIYPREWGDIQLDIVPSHIRLSNMESELIQTVDSDRILVKKLKNHEYDLIFIDPPPSFGKVNSISLMASSGILIPTQLSPYPIRALEYVMDRVRRVEEYKDDPLPILGIAVSMYDQRSTQFNQSMERSIREILAKNTHGKEIPLFPEDTWIPRLNIISRCPDQGYPIQEAEFDNQLPQKERESAQIAAARLEQLASHLSSIITPYTNSD